MVDESKEAERTVKKLFEEKGYMVFNQNDVGFPDLIVLKNRKLCFFIEVKARQEPDLSERLHLEYHQYLNELGFEVKYFNVKNQEIKEFKLDPSWEKAVKDSNTLLTKSSH